MFKQTGRNIIKIDRIRTVRMFNYQIDRYSNDFFRVFIWLLIRLYAVFEREMYTTQEKIWKQGLKFFRALLVFR